MVGKLSHYNIIKLANKRKHNKILILEDDFVFDNNALEKMTNVSKEINNLSDWDFIYLGTNVRHVKRFPIKDINFLKKVNHALTTHAYIVNCSAYKHIIDNAMNFSKEIDLFYIDMQKKRNKSFAANPLFIKQNDGFSDILKRNTKYKTVDN